jgi:hypothetical protein
MYRKRLFSIFSIITIISLYAGTAALQSHQLAATQQGALRSAFVTTAPIIDGNGTEAAWAAASALEIPVRTFGTPGFNITLKSVYDANNVYFLVQYPDSNCEQHRGAWAFNAANGAWERLSDDYGDEDEFGFFWNINIPNYSRAGCYLTCHGDKMIAPTGTTADDWRWNATRSNPMGWARDFHLTDDANADPAGGFTKDEGYATNRGYKDNVQTLGDVQAPLYWKPFSGSGGIVVGAPEYLLQSEIGPTLGQKITKVEADGTLVDEAGNRVPLFTHIPGWILSAPSGPSWNNIKARGTWRDGVWTVELSRQLNTGQNDDVQFQVGQEYYFDMYIKTRQPGEFAHAQVPVTKFVFVQ